jgi:hypothetical protein
MDYENETGLAWRGYRLLKAVTTYHTCGELSLPKMKAWKSIN